MQKAIVVNGTWTGKSGQVPSLWDDILNEALAEGWKIVSITSARMVSQAGGEGYVPQAYIAPMLVIVERDECKL